MFMYEENTPKKEVFEEIKRIAKQKMPEKSEVIDHIQNRGENIIEAFNMLNKPNQLLFMIQCSDETRNWINSIK